jgi:hypothetical protein
MLHIEATLELCTLLKGVPYGLSLISYTNPDNAYSSFKGIGFFTDGILHNAPFTCVN